MAKDMREIQLSIIDDELARTERRLIYNEKHAPQKNGLYLDDAIRAECLVLLEMTRIGTSYQSNGV